MFTNGDDLYFMDKAIERNSESYAMIFEEIRLIGKSLRKEFPGLNKRSVGEISLADKVIIMDQNKNQIRQIEEISTLSLGSHVFNVLYKYF